MKILIASSIYPGAIEVLREQHDVICAFGDPEEELQSLITDREILIFRSGVSISAEVMACAPDLKLLVRAGSELITWMSNTPADVGLSWSEFPNRGPRPWPNWHSL